MFVLLNIFDPLNKNCDRVYKHRYMLNDEQNNHSVFFVICISSIEVSNIRLHYCPVNVNRF